MNWHEPGENRHSRQRKEEACAKAERKELSAEGMQRTTVSHNLENFIIAQQRKTSTK